MTKKNWKADWPRPKSLFANRLHDILPNRGLSNIAKEYFLGASKNTVSKYIAGDSEPSVSEVLRVAEVSGCDIEWLMTGKGEVEKRVFELPQKDKSTSPMPAKSIIPPPNAIRRKGDQDQEHPVLHLRTVGDAAARARDRRSSGMFDEGELFWDEVEIPETTHMVKIRGDSMVPAILSGQYAMVGPQYHASEMPPHRSIVIAEIIVNDGDMAGSDEPWEGVHCKRIQDGGSVWVFTSIHSSGENFTALKQNCKLWPVVGVWFAGKGTPPEDD